MEMGEVSQAVQMSSKGHGRIGQDEKGKSPEEDKVKRAMRKSGFGKLDIRAMRKRNRMSSI